MLAARVGTTVDVDTEEFAFIPLYAAVQQIDDGFGARLGFDNRQITKLDAGASDDAFAKRAHFDRQTDVAQRFEYSIYISVLHIWDKEVLHHGQANVAATVLLRDVGD